MENRNYYTLILSLVGAVKLILNSFGIDLITDQMVNDLTNAIATVLTFAGVVMTHIKKKKPPETAPVVAPTPTPSTPGQGDVQK